MGPSGRGGSGRRIRWQLETNIMGGEGPTHNVRNGPAGEVRRTVRPDSEEPRTRHCTVVRRGLLASQTVFSGLLCQGGTFSLPDSV